MKVKTEGQKRTEFLLGIILALVGVILLFTGIKTTISNNTFKKENVEIEALVTDSNSVNKFTAVTFQVDEKEYNAMAKTYDSQIKTGDKITIYYNKENPSIIFIENNNTNGGVFIGLGIVLAAIGLSTILHKLNNSVNKEEIIRTGKKIQADLIDIVYDTKTTANGMHPYYVICGWKNKISGKSYRFKSESLWYDPKPQIKKSGIDKIPVFIIPSNPNQYYVAMDELNAVKKDEEK